LRDYYRIIELLNANEQLQREDMGRLLVLNEATGEKMEFPLQVGWGNEPGIYISPVDWAKVRNPTIQYAMID